jgi:hypothetical protein
MTVLKIAASDETCTYFYTAREVIPVDETRFTDVAAAAPLLEDLHAGALEAIEHTGFDIPSFLLPMNIPAPALWKSTYYWQGDASILMLLDRSFEYMPVAMMVQRKADDFHLLVDSALSEAYRSGLIGTEYDKHLSGTTKS